MRRLLSIALFIGLVFSVTFAAAQPNKWRTYLDSAKQAYKAGRYRDAIQLLQEAHRLSNKDELFYNIAKAGHLSYVEKKDTQDLRTAVDYYRKYLEKVPNGTRRLEATEALAELEPQLPKEAPVDPEDPYGEGKPKTPKPKPSEAARRTGVVVTTAAEGARIWLDGGVQSGSPLIAQTTPGMHMIRVEAPGFVPHERSVRVDAGVELALDIPLEIQPAFISLGGPDGASVFVDGKHMGDLPLRAPMTVSPGEHFVAVTQNGSFAFTQSLTLDRGGATHVAADLKTTGQRYASYGMFAAGAVGLVVGAVLTAAAVEQQSTAQQLQDDRQLTGGVAESDADRFDDAVSSRDDFRTAAVTTFGLSAAVLVTGFFLYLFDEPEVTTPPRRAPLPGTPGTPAPPTGPGIEIGAAPIVGPDGGGATLHIRF